MPSFATCSLVLATAVFPSLSQTQSWPITRIADSSTVVPGTAFTFDRFGLPACDGQAVGFSGFRDFNPTNAGMYRGSGGPLTVVADRTTPQPGQPGNFVSFASIPQYWPSLDGEATAFIGNGASVGGIYLRANGALTRVIDGQTVVPNGSGGTFNNMQPPTVRGERVAFSAWETGDAQRGVYSWQNNSVSIIADRSTPMPQGPGTFTGFDSNISLDSGRVVFSAFRDSFWGIYAHTQASGLTRLYDNNTLVPSSGLPFSITARASASGGHVAFYGGDGVTVTGVYSDVSGMLAAIADTNTEIPGSPGAFFTGFGHLCLDGDTVAFGGVRAGSTGVYFSRAGALHKVLAAGDAFDGRTVFDVFMGPQGLSGDYLAFQVRFTNGDWGIYRATIPAPRPAAPRALAALFAHRRRRPARPPRCRSR
jgi:hypothetical protein